MTPPVGRLDAICVAATAGAPMRLQTRIEAIPGRGLRGDRYEQGLGKFSRRFEIVPGARALSLIDSAAIAECNARLGSQLGACDLRRNLVVSGLDLDALHGATLAIGDVRLRLQSGCPPCGYLSRLLDVDAMQGLRHIGGARATILESGVLEIGASVELISFATGYR